MNDSTILLLIICMGLVTYIPRLVPTLFIGKISFNKNLEKFLKLIPYTAMAALIFPGVLDTDPNNIYIGLIGGVIAGVLAYFKCPVIGCVLAAIAANLIMYLL